MKIVVFIPARYGSTRFPGKPLANICGKPMIQHAYECAHQCREVEEVYAATDDERIAACVREFGGLAIMTSPDHPSGTDRIAEAAQKAGLTDDDIVVNIQGDQPLFPPRILEDLIRPLKEDPAIPMSTLKWRMVRQEDIHNPNHVKVVTTESGFALYFSRHPIPFCRDSDTLPIHFKHLGVYAYRAAFLKTFTRLPMGVLERAEKLEQLRALEYGYPIKVVPSEQDSIEVDMPQDIQVVEALLQKKDA